MDEDQSTAYKIVTEAVERGVNYFDVAPSYGNAEERLGPALRPYRDRVFLACKTLKRTKREAAEELHQSLKRLQTNFFDLYQFHGVDSLDDVQKIMGADGAIEAFHEARVNGLIRYVGFSSHNEDVAMKFMDEFRFDTILFPVNWASWMNGSFGVKVVEKAASNNVGILAIKGLAKRRLEEDEPRIREKCWYEPIEKPEEMDMAVRFTLSQPVTSMITPGHRDLFIKACDVADRFNEISRAETDKLNEMSKGLKPLFPQ